MTELKDGIHRVSVRIDSMVYMGNIWQVRWGKCVVWGGGLRCRCRKKKPIPFAGGLGCFRTMRSRVPNHGVPNSCCVRTVARAIDGQAVFGVAHPAAASSIVSESAFKDIWGVVIGTGDKTAAGSIHAESYTASLKQGMTISLVRHKQTKD